MAHVAPYIINARITRFDITFHYAFEFNFASMTRIYNALLGPCFKTGWVSDRPTRRYRHKLKRSLKCFSAPRNN